MTCTNEGKDRRYVRWLLCPLQNLLSFKSEREPRWLVKKLRHDSMAVWQEPGIEAGSYVSFGIAWFPEDGRDADALLGAADGRMYEDKERARALRRTDAADAE